MNTWSNLVRASAQSRSRLLARCVRVSLAQTNLDKLTGNSIYTRIRKKSVFMRAASKAANMELKGTRTEHRRRGPAGATEANIEWRTLVLASKQRACDRLAKQGREREWGSSSLPRKLYGFTMAERDEKERMCALRSIWIHVIFPTFSPFAFRLNDADFCVCLHWKHHSFGGKTKTKLFKRTSVELFPSPSWWTFRCRMSVIHLEPSSSRFIQTKQNKKTREIPNERGTFTGLLACRALAFVLLSEPRTFSLRQVAPDSIHSNVQFDSWTRSSKFQVKKAPHQPPHKRAWPIVFGVSNRGLNSTLAKLPCARRYTLWIVISPRENNNKTYGELIEEEEEQKSP